MSKGRKYAIVTVVAIVASLIIGGLVGYFLVPAPAPTTVKVTERVTESATTTMTKTETTTIAPWTVRNVWRDSTFENADVSFDGFDWSDCKFTNCNIIVERGEFSLTRCEFYGCRLIAEGNAAAIFELAKLILESGS